MEALLLQAAIAGRLAFLVVACSVEALVLQAAIAFLWTEVAVEVEVARVVTAVELEVAGVVTAVE